MSELSLKTHYSVAELLSFKLSSLPSAHKNVLEKAIRENWQSQKRKGRGGGVEYELISLPTEVQQEIRTKLLKLLPAEISKGELSVVRQNIDLEQITDKQLSTADARIMVVRWFLMQEVQLGLSRTKTLDQVIAAVASSEIPAEICKLPVKKIRLAR
ncbi:DNA-binding protein [Mannheimia haemolytica]|nr:DNA-binding protein [Mannheimia haemolytica]